MPPLEQTLLSSSNHSVGSGSSIFAKVRTNLALSPTRHTKPCISSKHSIHNNVTTSNVDSELRTLEKQSSSSTSSSSSLSDQSAKVLGSMKKASRNQFLAAGKKSVAQRKGDKRLNDAYYAYQFE